MSKRKAPVVTRLQIGPYSFPVDYVSGLVDPIKLDESVDGLISVGLHKFTVEADMPSLSQAQTMWHEIIHAFCTMMGRKHFDEGTINALAYFLLDVIRRNPDLVKLCLIKEE